MNDVTKRQATHSFLPRSTSASLVSILRHLALAFALLFAGNAAAVITVDLSINNDADANGDFLVVEGDKVSVNYEVIEDTDDDLHKNDLIQLVEVGTDEVQTSVKRGKKKMGKVALKVKTGGPRYYVRYVRKGAAGTEVARYAHPDDGDPNLDTISKLKLDEMNLLVQGHGAVSVQARAFQNENQNEIANTECIWRTTSGYGYILAVTGVSTGESCDVAAGISLPHGRTITEFHCTVYDNSDTNSISPDLFRTSLSTGSNTTMASTPASTDSTSVQILSDTTIVNPVIDNENYAYSLFMSYTIGNFNLLGNLGRVYGCSVHYK